MDEGGKMRQANSKYNPNRKYPVEEIQAIVKANLEKDSDLQILRYDAVRIIDEMRKGV